MIIANSDIGKYNKEHPDTPKLFLTAASAKTTLQTYENFAPEIPLWHNEIQMELRQTKVLATPLGRKRRFRGRYDQDMFRKAYAHIPQSTIGEYAHQAIIKLEYLLPEGSEIIQEGFDSFLAEVREGDEEKVSELVKLAFDKEMYWKGERFKIPFEEAGRGKRWKK